MATVSLQSIPPCCVAALISDLDRQGSNQNRPYAQAAYNMPNGAPGVPAVPPPGAAPLLPNQGRVLQQGAVRVLCIADVRGMFLKGPRYNHILCAASLISLQAT